MCKRLIKRYFCRLNSGYNSDNNMLTFRSLKNSIAVVLMVLAWQSTAAQDTLKIMYYNVLNYPGSTPERVSYFRTIAQFTTPDVMLITELLSEEGADDLLSLGLNTGNINTYARAQFTDGPDSDNMLYYNDQKLGLKSQDTIQTALRLINAYTLYCKTNLLASGGDTVFIHFFVGHLKASTGSTNEQKRLEEVMELQDYLMLNNITENIVFGGDLNFYGSDEPAYQYITDLTGMDLHDPLPAGDWHDNPAFATIHTQSTRTDQFGGGATGGCDDRFDFIFFSNDLVNGNQPLNYIPGSTTTLGNDGQHFNVSILDPPVNSTIPDSVLNALYYMADHLPVISLLSLEPEPVTAFLDLKVYLEGSFNGTGMNTSLTPYLPVEQPFNEVPWLYDGTEMLEAGSPTGVVDWCLLELRVTNGTVENVLSDTAVWRKACLLMNDGSIREADKVSLPSLVDNFPGNKYLIIRHRNHLDILSANPPVINGDQYVYDFTTSAGQVYGGSSGYSLLQNGSWGMSSGDTDENGLINQSDISGPWKTQAGSAGFLNGDVNLDGQVDNADKNRFILPNLSKYSPLSQ